MLMNRAVEWLLCMAVALGMTVGSAHAQPQVPGQWAMEAAVASYAAYYSDQATRREILASQGLSEVMYEELGDQEVLIARALAENVMFVAFAGTDMSDESDFQTDLSTELAEPSDLATLNCAGRNCLVHKGFDALVSRFRSSRIGYYALNASGRGSARLVVTGHSLGGALAQLTAAYWRQASQFDRVITFGAPMVGNQGFRDTYGADQRLVERTHRWVADGDPATRYPRFFPTRPEDNTRPLAKDGADYREAGLTHLLTCSRASRYCDNGTVAWNLTAFDTRVQERYTGTFDYTNPGLHALKHYIEVVSEVTGVAMPYYNFE